MFCLPVWVFGCLCSAKEMGEEQEKSGCNLPVRKQARGCANVWSMCEVTHFHRAKAEVCAARARCSLSISRARCAPCFLA